MKLLKNNFRKSIHITVLLSILFVGCSEVIVDPPPKLIENEFTEKARVFLSKNNFTVDLMNDNTFAVIPDSVVTNSEVLFTGENHGVKENVDIQLNLFKYLNKKYKTNYLLLELGYSTSQLYNKYLESGDIEILNNIFKWLKGTYYWTNEQYNKWINLYNYNQLLPDEEKIIVVGVDVEHQYFQAIEYLDDILPTTEPPAEIKNLIDELKSIRATSSSTGSQIKTLAENITNSMKNNHSLYEDYLGESYFDFEIVISGIDKLFEWSDSKDYNIRDGYMYDTFIKQYSKLPSGKYYGNFGSAHIQQRIIGGTNWFAGRLSSEGSPVNNRVHSILFLYKNSKAITKNGNNRYGTTTYNTIPIYFDFFNEDNLTNLTWFSLIGNDSPFEDNSLLKYYQDESGFEFPLAEYFQSIILIKNGNAMTPLN